MVKYLNFLYLQSLAVGQTAKIVLPESVHGKGIFFCLCTYISILQSLQCNFVIVKPKIAGIYTKFSCALSFFKTKRVTIGNLVETRLTLYSGNLCNVLAYSAVVNIL